MSKLMVQINIMVFLSSIRRLAHIVFVIIRHTLTHIVGMIAGRMLWLENILKLKPLTGPQRLHIILEEIGGTFIKFGQMLALQPDILSPRYCNVLFDLLDKVPPFDAEEVERVFIEELGKKPTEIFSTFDLQPFATGSIGQVHQASLAANTFAVKVQRPTAIQDFAIDIRLIGILNKLIKIIRLKRLYWLIEPLSEFISWTNEELDYRNEALHMDELGQNAEANSKQYVPSLLKECTTKRLLSAEYIHGLTVLDYLRVRAGDGTPELQKQAINIDSHCLAKNIVDSFLNDALQNGIFHADLHPANLIIMQTDKIGYVDFGIVGTLTPYVRHYLAVMTLAYIQGNMDALCDSFFKISVKRDLPNQEKFKSELKALAKEWYVDNGAGRKLQKSITQVMIELLKLSRITGVLPHRTVVKYIRSAVTLDGLVKIIAPDISISHCLEKACKQHLEEQILYKFIISTNSAKVSQRNLRKLDNALAKQEVENIYESIKSFGLIDSQDETVIKNLPPLRERIKKIAALDSYHSLWSTEGLGYEEAEAAWQNNQKPTFLLIPEPNMVLPEGSIVAFYVGMCLSTAKHYLQSSDKHSTVSTLKERIGNFIDLTENSCPQGCEKVAADALGLVVRTLFPSKLIEIDDILQKIAPHMLAYYWHGVGRGLYFNFPPALFSQEEHSIALECVNQEPPHEIGKLNTLAGFARPLALVNIRHPAILNAFLQRHSSQIYDQDAFVNGIATSILLWRTWAGNDHYLKAFMNYQSEGTILDSKVRWVNLIKKHCLEVLKRHNKILKKTKRYGEIFCYQPLSILAERLKTETEAGKPPNFGFNVANGFDCMRGKIVVSESGTVNDEIY